MFSHFKESFKDSVPDRYRKSNFPMFPFHLEGNSDRNNDVLGSPQTSLYDTDMASLEERKLQKMMHDIGRNKGSVNKYRGHVPPLVKVKDSSLSPVRRSKQFREEMRKQEASKAIVEKPGNDLETQNSAEKKRWKNISIGQKKPRDKCPKKTGRAVPASKNAYSMPKLQGAMYEAKPFKLLPPISNGKKNMQDLNGQGEHQKKVKTGFIPVRHTKKSAQIENNMKVKCDVEVPHAQSTAARKRQAFTDVVPGSSDKKRSSSPPDPDWSTRKQSSSPTNASDKLTTCIASTAPQVVESASSILPLQKPAGSFHDISGSLQSVDVGPDSVGYTISCEDDNIFQKKASVEREKCKVTIFEKSLKQETPECRSGISSESVTGDNSCESTRSDLSSRGCAETGKSVRLEEQSPVSGESSRSKPSSYRRSVRGVSKRSRRDRRSRSRSPSPVRNNASVKSGYQSSNRSGKKSLASGSSGGYSPHVSTSVDSRISTRNHKSRSRSQSPHRIRTAPRLGTPESIRSVKMVDRKASSHASPSSSSVSTVASSRSQKSRILSPCDVTKSNGLIRPCQSRSKSSDVPSSVRECISRSRNHSSCAPRLSASLKSVDSCRSGNESIARRRSRKSSLSCCSSRRSPRDTSLRSPSPCNVEKSARLSKSGTRNSMRSKGETGQGGPSPCHVVKSARLSKTGSCDSKRSTFDIGPRSRSLCSVEKSARRSKHESRNESRNSRIKVDGANDGSPLLSKSTCNLSPSCSSGKLYSSRSGQNNSARSCNEKKGIDIESGRIRSSKRVPKYSANVDILESRSSNTPTRSLNSSLSSQEKVRSVNAINSNGKLTRSSSNKSISSIDKEGKQALSESSSSNSRSNASFASSMMSSTAGTIRSENGMKMVKNGSRNGSISKQKSDENNEGKLPKIKSSRSVSSASGKSARSSTSRLSSGWSASNANITSTMKSAVRSVSARVTGSSQATPMSPTTQSSVSDKCTTLRTPRGVSSQSSRKSAISKKSATPRDMPPTIPARTRSATYSSTTSQLKDNTTRPYSSGSSATKSVTFSSVSTFKKWQF